MALLRVKGTLKEKKKTFFGFVYCSWVFIKNLNKPISVMPMQKHYFPYSSNDPATGVAVLRTELYCFVMLSPEVQYRTPKWHACGSKLVNRFYFERTTNDKYCKEPLHFDGGSENVKPLGWYNVGLK